MRLRLIGGVLLALGAAGIAFAWAGGPDTFARDQVVIEMRYSSFSRTSLTAQAGEPITIVLVNDDPIDHEWMAGDAAFHERHRNGTEPVHGTRSTEVTVPAGETRTTTVTFQRPGDYLFICHLPGHEAYGMVGVVHVVGSAGS